MSKATETSFGRAFALRSAPYWFWDFAKRGRIVAAFRNLWWALALGWVWESCDDCGRGCGTWWCDDDALFDKVAGVDDGNAALCMACFERKATRIGIQLVWNPILHSQHMEMMERKYANK